MRLAIIATPALSPDLRPPPGALDGDALRARLAQRDTGFAIRDLDPAVDLAEQLDRIFDEVKPGASDEVLLYVSCKVVISGEGEFFVCLDPQHPETGDSLADIRSVFVDRAPGPALFILECRHRVDARDPFQSANVVAAAKEATEPVKSGVSLLIAARPGADGVEEKPSPFTQALLAALDEATDGEGLSAEAVYAGISESEQLLGLVPCFAHAKGRSTFELLAGRVTSIRPPAPDEDEEPEAALEAPQEDAEAHEASEDDAADSDARATEPYVSTLLSRSKSMPPTALPEGVSFKKAEQPPPPRVVISDRPMARLPGAMPVPVMPAPAPLPRVTAAEMVSSKAPSLPPAPRTAAEHVALADSYTLAKDYDGASSELKKALVLIGAAGGTERAEVYVRIGQVKHLQKKPREAIASFEKALQMIPTHAGAQTALLELSVADEDWRAVQVAEDRLLASMTDPEERFVRLLEFGVRWANVAKDLARARATLEKAREIKSEHLALLSTLREVYEATSSIQEALATRRQIAVLTPDPRTRAKLFFELGQHHRLELKRDDVALELFDLGLDSDPSMLEPLEIIASLLAERQEWGELEKAYRRMLGRVERIPKGEVRTEVTWELCRRLGLLFRDHLEDPKLALDAFEDSLEEKPEDLGGHLVAADLAKSLGELDAAASHLQTAAMLDPGRLVTFHDLFELFQRGKNPDLAFCAASVTMHLRNAESRERFIFEELRAQGVPKFARALRPEAWDLLRPDDRDRLVEAILDAIAPAAIAARIAYLGSEGRLPTLDPAQRQDPEKSTVSITRSFSWASHFIGIPAPAIYLREDTSVGIAAMLAEEPTVVAGSGVLRGRSLPDLAFLVGRHLGYYAGAHKLLLHYPSIEELSACFIAAVKIILRDVPIPPSVRDMATQLKLPFETRLGEQAHAALEVAVKAFDVAGGRADLGKWVSSVERCATRAGALLAGDLGVAATLLRAEPRSFLSAEEKINDLIGFWVSPAHHALRQELGIAIEP